MSMETSGEGGNIVIRLHKPSLKEKLFFLLSGVIVSVPLTLFIYSFTNYLCIPLPMFYATLCSVVVFTPFVEEFAKAYPLFYRHGETEKSLFALGFLVGLGFGLAEFFVYVLALEAPFYVRLPGILFHAASTSITAYGIAKKHPTRFYLIAVVLHLSYNVYALLGGFWFLSVGFVATLTYFLSWYLYHAISGDIADQSALY